MPTPGADAAFAEAVTLTVAAGVGGSVDMSFPGGGPMGSVGPGSQQGFTLSALSAPVLGAVPAPGYAFAGWALSDGLAWRVGTTGQPHLRAGARLAQRRAPATATATFGPVPSTLAVAAGAGGSVEAAIAGAAAETVGPASRRGFLFSAASSATLSAVPAAGYAFAGWTLSGPPAPACAPETAAETCELAAGSVTAGATVSAAFAAVPSTLTVIAGVGGSVDVRGDGGLLIGEVAAGASEAFPFSAASSARLVASPAPGYAFDGWTLSRPAGAGVRAGDGRRDLRAGRSSVSADATAEAAFAAVPTTLTVAAGPTARWRPPSPAPPRRRSPPSPRASSASARRARRRSRPSRTPATRSPAGRCPASRRRRARGGPGPTHASWRPARSLPTPGRTPPSPRPSP